MRLCRRGAPAQLHRVPAPSLRLRGARWALAKAGERLRIERSRLWESFWPVPAATVQLLVAELGVRRL